MNASNQFRLKETRTYKSKTIQGQITDICGEVVAEKIVSKVPGGKVFFPYFSK